MKDLSNNSYAQHAIVAGSSMAAGNTVNKTAQKDAMTAPGSDPVDPIPANDKTDDPNIDLSNKKPNSLGVDPRNSTSYTPTPVEWKTL